MKLDRRTKIDYYLLQLKDEKGYRYLSEYDLHDNNFLNFTKDENQAIKFSYEGIDQFLDRYAAAIFPESPYDQYNGGLAILHISKYATCYRIGTVPKPTSD